ncbi:uncharacterized protein SPPG_03963 [Spizellomyces punctatus DAOM BR117]|uniref:NudC domain-containing protein 1 n=1 Tax=Spizellomyces punctatus (strain DAOM BR117) TaxID=645134 RepID=A0A0L0HJ52_SPIPD|nr:uncharacterized protein SPPG_03963 [Spizellomyces punctatus DAOM BR117]KND00859.1 hypothetical protein SPPG_03963 [Spizellomyces punctatus DAOM BR117]|eukprot:XP_016608898.1 hypothetical protein SPPG_03963 [Spizellomyces punctatus DAOM BR117]
MPAANPPRHVQLSVDRSLLNPKFEGYKLKTHDGVREPKTFDLPEPVNIGKVPSSTHAPYRKLEARSGFNHLFAFPEWDCAFYVDGEYNVIQVLVNEDAFEPSFRTLYSFPAPTLANEEREYPSIQRAGQYLLISSGAGSIAVIHLADTTSFPTFIGELRDLDHPYILTNAKTTSSGNIVFLAYRTEEREVEEPVGHTATSFSNPQQKELHPRLSFFLSLFQIENADLREGRTANGSIPVTRLRTVEGFSVPYFSAIEPEGQGFTIAAAIPYENPKPRQVPVPEEQQEHQPQTKAELIRREQEIEFVEAKKLEYMWTQTGEDIMITVRLPHITLKKDIHCRFDNHGIKCKILPPKEETIFDARTFDNIVPGECTWTLENNRLLTLYIQKANENTRWTHLWEDEDDVEETVDPSELATFREALEKYTASDENPESAYPMQNAMTERSEEVDFEGHAAVFVRFAREGGEPTAISLTGGQEWLCTCFPWRPRQNESLGSVCLRSDVDALIYDVGTELQMTHTSAFNALGFVQASKRDKRFMFVTYDYQKALIIESRRHVYIYRQPFGNSVYADQYVVDLDPGRRGVTSEDVLGVQQIGEDCIAILKEGSLSLIQLVT